MIDFTASYTKMKGISNELYQEITKCTGFISFSGKKYSDDQLMHIILDNFQLGGKYIAQISGHQAELIRDEKLLIKNIYLLHLYIIYGNNPLSITTK